MLAEEPREIGFFFSCFFAPSVASSCRFSSSLSQICCVVEFETVFILYRQVVDGRIIIFLSNEIHAQSHHSVAIVKFVKFSTV